MTALERIEAPSEAEVEAFAMRMVAAYNSGALSLMTALGHRLGLFDVLAGMAPATSEAIAREAGVAERYLREWLAVMVTSGVVSYEPKERTYGLPAAHAAVLTRAAGAMNLASTAQFVSSSAALEEEMVQRFRDGRGMHYHDYPRFHQVMAEDSYKTVVLALDDQILPLVPGLEDRLEAGIDVVDLGCGAGRALLHLARRFPQSRFTGLDLCADAFASTVKEAERSGLTNLVFRAADVSRMDRFGAFDLVLAFDAIHDQADPQGMLRTVAASLRPGGIFLAQEIGGSGRLEEDAANPFGPLLYMMSVMHCTPISLGQGGPGLGTMWGVPTAQAMLAEAGFTRVATHRLASDPISIWFVAER